LRAVSNLSPENEDFRSTRTLIGKLTDDELRIMHEQIQETIATPGFAQLRRLMRLEHEQQTRVLTAPKVLEHAKYAHTAGLLYGLTYALGLPLVVEKAHVAVQRQLAAERDDDGEK
jgi:hypothetical protein